MNIPSLWLEEATLKDIDGVVVLGQVPEDPDLSDSPITFSPTWNTPDDILISSSLGNTYLLTSWPSKNAYNLFLGLNLLPSTVIFLDLTAGESSLLISLVPCVVLFTSSTTRVLTPLLAESTRFTCWLSVSSLTTFLVLLTNLRPSHWVVTRSTSAFLVRVVTSVSVPVHVVCQEFHTVGANPDWGSTLNCLWALAIVEAKLPSLLMILGSMLTVSTHVSPAGVNSILPCQKGTKKGVTLSVLVPKVCFNHSTSEYPKVKASPVFLTLIPPASANARSSLGSTLVTGPNIISTEEVKCFGLSCLFALSILFWNSIPSSWESNVLKLSTKKPALYLLAPSLSAINILLVLDSNNESAV